MSRKSKKQVKSINKLVTFRLSASNASKSKQLVFGVNRDSISVDRMYEVIDEDPSEVELVAQEYIHNAFLTSQFSSNDAKTVEGLMAAILMTMPTQHSKEQFTRVWNSPNPVLTFMSHDVGEGYHMQTNIGAFDATIQDFHEDIIKFMVTIISDEKAKTAVQDAAEAVIH